LTSVYNRHQTTQNVLAGLMKRGPVYVKVNARVPTNVLL